MIIMRIMTIFVKIMIIMRIIIMMVMVRSGVAPNSHWRTVPHRSAMDQAETTAVPSMGIFLISDHLMIHEHH